MKFITDYTLEDYILNTTWDDFPEPVRERAAVCGIDLMIALLLGSRGKQFQAGLNLAKQIYRDGDVPIVGSQEHLHFMGATVVMAHAANSFDIDDGHNMIKGHPGASFVAGILAAALEKDVSYKEYLVTLVIAYETAIRWAVAMQDHYGYLHSTGAYGSFGSAAGVGRLFGLSREELNNALSVADFHAPMTPVMRAVEYPSMNKDGVPFGTMIGTMAVLETLAGTSGKTHLLELEKYRDHLRSLGSHYEIMNLYFKPYTCCRWAHQPIHASLGLMRENGITPDDIESVMVHTFNSAARLSKIVPQNTDEAQYNIAYPVATAILNGDLGYLQIRDEALGDPQVIHFMKKLHFVVDPEIEAQFPGKRLARVELALKDGRTFTSDTIAAPGEAGDGVDLEWINQKFDRLTKPLLTPEKQKSILEMLKTPSDMKMREIIAYMNQ